MGDTIEYNIQADNISSVLNIVKDHGDPWGQVNMFIMCICRFYMKCNSRIIACCFEIEGSARNIFSFLVMTKEMIPTSARSLGQGNVFTPVCQSFCSQGGLCLWVRGVCASGSGGCLPHPPRHTPFWRHTPETPPEHIHPWTHTPLDTHSPWTHHPRHTPWTHTHTHTHTHTSDTHTPGQPPGRGGH